MTTSGKNDWLSILPAIVENYNNTVHTTTKRTPEEVYNNINFQSEVKQIFQAKQLETNPVNDLFIGDQICTLHINFIQRQKNKLLKGYIQQWSDEISIIKRVIKPNLTTQRRYLIDKDAKQYFRWQLQKIKI